jgi:hypothetical protein
VTRPGSTLALAPGTIPAPGTGANTERLVFFLFIQPPLFNLPGGDA